MVDRFSVESPETPYRKLDQSLWSDDIKQFQNPHHIPSLPHSLHSNSGFCHSSIQFTLNNITLLSLFFFNTSHRVLIWIHLFVLNKHWETLTESRIKIYSEWLSRGKYIKDSQRVWLKWQLCDLLCHIGSLYLTGDEDSDPRELSWRCTSCNKNLMGRNIFYKIANIL